MIHVPEEQPGFWRRPLGKSAEVARHCRFEHVPLFTVELRDSLRMRLERLVAPGIEQGKTDGLRERWRL